MLKITQIPQRTLGVKKITYKAPILTLDEVDYDLSELADGATAEWEIEDSQIIKLDRVGNDYFAEILVWFDPTDGSYYSSFSAEDLVL